MTCCAKLFKEWRNYADDYVLGDFYPMTPYSLDSDVWMVWQFNRPETGEGVVQGFRRSGSPYEAFRAKLQGLDPQARYRLTNLDEEGSAMEKTGADLMNNGISLQIENQPGSVVVTYKRLAR